MRKTLLIGLLFAVLPLAQSCVISTKTTAVTPQIMSLFKGAYKVDPYLEGHMPKTVAVLPFVDKSGSKEGSDVVRKGFYNHFSSLPFQDVELYRVDSLLAKAGLTDPLTISETSPQKLGEILGVDAVVYGDISNFNKLFAVVYSQVSVGAEIKMYDTKTGNFLWSSQHVVRIHEGGISTTPIGVIATVIATSMNVRDIQLLRACDDLFRDMVKTIPVPTIAEAMKPPTITLLTQDTKGLPKKAGDEIRVVIQGTSKMQASFDIGTYRKSIPMEEMEPGGYLGIYRVVPGDNASDLIITGHLSDRAGNSTSWVDALGTVSLDTTPPDKPQQVNILGKNAAVSLSWKGSAAPDVAGYLIYRSPTPLSGFLQIGKTEFNNYQDVGLSNLQRYYYRLAALDRAGNESDKTDALLGVPVAPGPTAVSGEIDADTTWYAGAGPYIVKDPVTVKDTAMLFIEPGTEVQVEKGGIIVAGRLDAQGDAGRLIVFSGAAGASWDGITFRNTKDRENVLRFCAVRGATHAVTCEASSPRLEENEFSGNGEGIFVSGSFSKPVIAKNTLRNNKGTAITVADGAQPEISANTILDNDGAGIEIKGAAPEITGNIVSKNRAAGIVSRGNRASVKANNIIDNTPLDLIADKAGQALAARDNWWGTTQGLEIIARVKGRVDLSEVLDGPAPGGKVLVLPIATQKLEGSYKTDTYLTLLNSPFLVTRDVAIDGGATLYVERGVTITYDQNTSLILADGGIIARGTATEPILFTASGSSPQPGFYASAVRFSAPTKVNSAFAFCVVKYAATAFDVWYGTPEIASSLIASNSQSGIFCRNDAAPKVSFNTFRGNLGEGAIKCVGMSNPSIHHNNFRDNTVALQSFSSIYVDARNNWWGQDQPDPNEIWGENVNTKPWLAAPEAKAFDVP
ncbi:MAG: DUF799 family lipoprotein [Smithellaceae bacterium]|nr:DUF799 family lipoprotein [Smithellaceae bacterium]